MKHLYVYKSDMLEMQTLSVEHFLSDLERTHIKIKELRSEGNELARIRADRDIFTVFEAIQKQSTK